MKKILLSVGIIAIVAVGAIGATRAYFTNTETSTGNTFTAGTLDLNLSNGSGWSNGVSSTWSSPANWAPGQTVSKSIYLKNAGTIPAAVIYANWTNLVDVDGMANYIEVTKISDSTNSDSTATFKTYYDDPAQGGGNGDSVLSLAELVHGLSSATTPAPFKAKFYADENGDYENPVLPAGGEFRIDLDYKFMVSAPNTLQGKQASFDLVLQAAQLPFSGTIQY